MTENGTREHPVPHEHYAPGVVGLDLPDLNGFEAHYPSPPLLMHMPEGVLRCRQVCGWCGELLLEEEHPLPTAILVPGREGPKLRHLPVGLWIALFEEDGNTKAQIYQQGVRPREACMWRDYPVDDDEADG